MATRQANTASLPPNQNFFKLFIYADRADYLLMALGTIGAMGSGLCMPFFYYVLARILQSFGESRRNPQQAADEVAKFALDLLYVGLVSLFCSFAEMVCWVYSGQRQASSLRQAWLYDLLSQNKNFFRTNEEIELAAQRFCNNYSLVQDAISKMGTLVYFLVTCIGGFGVAFFLMWKIGLGFFAYIAVLFSTYLLYSFRLNNQKYNEGTLSIVEQSVDHIRTVYSNVYEKNLAKAFTESVTLNFWHDLTKRFGWEMVMGSSFFVVAFFLWYAGVLVRNSEGNGGKAIAAILAAFEASTVLLRVIAITTALENGKEAVCMILQVLSMQNEVVSEEGPRIAQVTWDLRLEDVTFSYPSSPNHFILQHVSFRIPSGQIVALAGARNSGKSTVVSLILRQHKPTQGTIFLDTFNICNLDLSWYHNQIVLLTEETLIFKTSVLENIRYGNKHTTRRQVEAAAKEANAHSFISNLPNGYETEIGGSNFLLSDGQLQRLVIARAFLKNPKLLLLDEPTCGLNAMSERPVQEAIEQLMGQRTTLVIAHRLSTIQNAYQVIVLQDGHIVQMGTHNQLITSNEYGPYSILVKMNEMTAGGDGTILGRTAEAARTKSKLSSLLNMENIAVEPMNHQERQESGGDEEPADDDNAQAVAAERLTSQQITLKVVAWRLAKMSAPLWSCAFLGSLGAIICGMLFSPTFGYVLGKLLQVYYETDAHKMNREVQKYALLLVGAGVARVGIQWMQIYYFGVIAETISARMKEGVFEGILKQEVGWYDLEDLDGKRLAEKMVSIPVSLHCIFPNGLAASLKCTSCFITSFIVGFVIDWRFTLVMLPMFFLLVISAICQELVALGFQAVSDRPYTSSTTIIEDLIKKIRLVSASNVYETLTLFKNALSKPNEQVVVRDSFFVGVSRLMYYGTHGLLLWYGSRLFRNGTSDFGSIIVVFMVLSTSATEIGGLVRPVLSAMESFRMLCSVCALIDRETSIQLEEGSSEIVESLAGTVEFIDVSFAYPTRPDVTILKGLHLNVKARQRIALVGAHGSGKSALIALIERFYDANKGMVTIDGKDIKKLNLRSLRQLIGFVQSDPVIFQTTIKDNILCGKEHVLQKELQEAAEASEAHIFISALPRGYRTKVDASGTWLNLGQRQRITIARANVKKPPILLVDDATSGLDSKEAKCVQEVVENAMIGRTAIVVTHNLIDICSVVDSICVLEGGHIVEQGSHRELMAAGGSYACLFNIQRAREQARERQNKPSSSSAS